MNLQESIRRILREEKLYVTPQELIRNLPKDLKDILFKQWGAKQNPEWHPEGNTLKHILVVIKRAYHHYPDDPNMVMAALFHDLGKIDTYKINPKTGQPTAYGHEDKSTDYVEQFRDWIESFEGTDVDEIKYLVKNHMKVKPSTWDQMKDKKKEPIMSHPAFDKLMGFTDKLDGGGTHLKESIRKILKELYSPEGRKVKPKKIVIHKSEKENRKSIKQNGLIPKTGFCYKNYVNITGEKKCRPAIFATNSKNPKQWFAVDWDGDVWAIDTTIIPDVIWYEDSHMFPEGQNKHIVTFDKIPPHALTLIQKGTE